MYTERVVPVRQVSSSQVGKASGFTHPLVDSDVNNYIYTHVGTYSRNGTLFQVDKFEK